MKRRKSREGGKDEKGSKELKESYGMKGKGIEEILGMDGEKEENNK